MAVYVLDQYQNNSKALAEYLASTINEYNIIEGSTSNTGIRKHKIDGYTYSSTIVDIYCPPIVPTVDCFVNTDKSIVAKIYIPKFEYIVSSEDKKGRTPCKFECFSNPEVVICNFPAKNLKSYEDFELAMNSLVEKTKEVLAKAICKLTSPSNWEFVDIDLSVDFNVYQSTKAI